MISLLYIRKDTLTILEHHEKILSQGLCYLVFLFMSFWIRYGMQIYFIHKISVCSRGTSFPRQNKIQSIHLHPHISLPLYCTFLLSDVCAPLRRLRALNRPWKSAFQHSHVLMRYANYSMARCRFFSFTRTLFIR